jgi:rubrerythrin
MGKKTDTFTTNLQNYSDQSLTLTPKLIVACQSVPKLFDSFSKLETAHNARSTQIIKECGNDPNEFEPKIAKDPDLTKLDAALEKIGGELMAARHAKETSLAALKQITVKLKTETKTFETYISAKEKSKNPFKSKKSLPTAKELIKAANDLIIRNQAVID